MKLDLITMGHIVYDIRCYVEEFPHPDKTTFMYTTIKTSGGGSAANVAVDASVLGLKSGLIGNVGSDEHGAILLQDLRKSRVDISRVNVCEGESGVSIVLVNRKAEVEVVEMIGVNEPLKEVDIDYIESAKFLHLTGTSLNALKKASSAGAKSGLTVSFDPGRSKSHLGLRKLESIIKKCDYLILNRHELARLTKIKEPHEAAKKIARRYELTCIVKGGARPVIVEGKDSLEMAPFNVKARDTIGAGDAFTAGFITALKERKKLERALKFANAAAAAKVMHLGAQSLPKRSEIKRLFRV
ncbi:MAG: PfkB family carbohydrate kinase [Candidatus Micrarchaeota archaeon]